MSTTHNYHLQHWHTMQICLNAMRRYQFPVQVFFMQSVEQSQPFKTLITLLCCLGGKAQQDVQHWRRFLKQVMHQSLLKRRSRKFIQGMPMHSCLKVRYNRAVLEWGAFLYVCVTFQGQASPLGSNATYVSRHFKIRLLLVDHSAVTCNLLTYSMVQSPSWEANWFAASQEIPRISWNPKVHYRTHKHPPPVPILGQPNPVHIPTSHLLEIHPNIIHPSTPRSPQWSLSLWFPHQDVHTYIKVNLSVEYYGNCRVQVTHNLLTH